MEDSLIITQTSNWIKSVVIGCNFCPFAAKAFTNKNIGYRVHRESNMASSLMALQDLLVHLDENEDTETAFLIFPESFNDFHSYLDLVDKAERLIYKNGYEGIYQVASFHPGYCFEGAPENDAANYTNRSIYPMLHLLREDSLTAALGSFKNPELIPEKNVAFARQKGLEYMAMLRASCL